MKTVILKGRFVTRFTFYQLAKEMVREDLKPTERGGLIKQHDYSTFDCHE